MKSRIPKSFADQSRSMILRRCRVVGLRGKLAALIFNVLLFSSTSARAEVVSLNPVADTFILDSAPANNNGGTEGFTVGRDDNNGIRRGLIRFDLSVIPRGSTITSAVLQLTVTKDPPQRVDTDFHLYRVLKEWGEGDKKGFRPGNGGAPATIGESTWNARLTAIEDWTTPGALDDAVSPHSATAAVAGIGLYSWTQAGVRDDVQLWVDQPALNSGWLIICADEMSPRTARKFGSREFSPNPAPPELQVGFVAPPVLSAPTSISPSTFRFTVTTVANTTNIVQVTTSLAGSSAWVPIEMRVPTNDVFTVTDTNVEIDSVRIYRVVRQ